MQLLHFIVGLSMLVALAFSASEERVMGWNKAHGLWGKRSLQDSANKRTPQNWNKLNSLWGKRSSAPFDSTDYGSEEGETDGDVAHFYKRAPAQWQRANGLWGR